MSALPPNGILGEPTREPVPNHDVFAHLRQPDQPSRGELWRTGLACAAGLTVVLGVAGFAGGGVTEIVTSVQDELALKHAAETAGKSAEELESRVKASCEVKGYFEFGYAPSWSVLRQLKAALKRGNLHKKAEAHVPTKSFVNNAAVREATVEALEETVLYIDEHGIRIPGPVTASHTSHNARGGVNTHSRVERPVSAARRTVDRVFDRRLAQRVRLTAEIQEQTVSWDLVAMRRMASGIVARKYLVLEPATEADITIGSAFVPHKKIINNRRLSFPMGLRPANDEQDGYYMHIPALTINEALDRQGDTRGCVLQKTP